MQILFVAELYSYGVKARGYSSPYFDFFEPLRRAGHDIIYFDVPTLTEKYGFEAMSNRLAEIVKNARPALTFCVLTGDQVKRKVMRKISESGLTITVNWYCDDHFNFRSFSTRWTPCFNWVVTTAACTLPWYEQLGLKNVIKSQWGCNPFIYRKLDLPLKYDVTFVGARHGNRPEFIQALRASGLCVQCWGAGWGAGRLSQEQMVAVINQSRINLNFTNGAVPPTALYAWRQRMKHTPFGRMENSSLGLAVKRQIKRLIPKPRRQAGEVISENPAAEVQLPEDLSALQPDGILQIKARTFDVPGCGGFLMTSDAENLSEYLANDRELAIFTNARELVEKARYYLDNEPRRAAVADAGYRRVMNEHTYVHRFSEIFERLKLPPIDIQAVLNGKLPIGSTEFAD